ncbi:MAG: protoporphyrinogen oxidase [Bryobacterales bacterium]|nr:protoporphyrinogen oxidase [Bryobacterales bacterium]
MVSNGAVIIGGGISGLSAAYDLARAGFPHTIIEKRPRLGGVIETHRLEGCILEGGPDSFISQKPEALALIKDLGLESDVTGSNDRTRTTYILKHGRLVKLPEGVMMIVPSRVMPVLESPLLGWRTKIRMGLEMFRKPQSHPDRSVAEFVIDHFGEETLDYMAEPLLSGVYGGDPRQMSIISVLPRFAEWEAKYGSLARAALKARGKTPSGSGPLFRTLKSGLATLTETLAKNVCHRQAEAQAIEREGDAFRVGVDGEWITAKHVVLACPAWAASTLVGPIDAALSARLAEIPYTSSATVTLGYRDSGFDGKRAGHGFLVPQKERKRLAACTFVNEKFPNRAPAGVTALRCFFGGAGDDAVLNESDESLVAMARAELQRILGLTAAPFFHTISRWPRSMAQYTVGHGARWKEIESRIAATPGLHLAGNGYTGIGVPDCIRMGRQAAARILKR